jgi:hypothetical protein
MKKPKSTYNSIRAACAILPVMFLSPVLALDIQDSDIKDDSYTFSLSLDRASDAQLMSDLLSESTELVARDEGGGVVYITPNPGATAAELLLTFDFSDSSYAVESVSVREVFNFFVRPDQPSDAVVKASVSWDGDKSEDLWSVVCDRQSRHEKPFESSVEVGGTRKVVYRLSMEILGDDALGSFGDAAFQWNRLTSRQDDSTRSFRITFKLKKAS